MSHQRILRRRTTVPAAPTGAIASAGNTTCSVAFSAPVTDGGSAITQYRAISTPGGFSNTGSASPIVVSGLTNGVAYTFTVRATNAVGNSAESAASNSATPTNPSTVPGAPTIGTATAGAQPTYGDWRATISFSAPGSDGGSPILDYLMTAVPSGVSASGAGSPITVTGLPSSQSYAFNVAARNAIGYGASSSNSNAVTPISVPQAPPAPTATAGTGQATVTVNLTNPNGGASLSSCTVTSSPGGFTGTSFSVGGSTVDITVTGLTNGTPYTFTAKTANSAGESSASSASGSVTPTVIDHTVTLDVSTIVGAMLGEGVLSDNCTATPVNGAGPFAYSWAWVSGGTGITLTNVTTATVTIEAGSGGSVPPNRYKSGVVRCTVTDNGNGGYTASADCTVDFAWEW